MNAALQFPSSDIGSGSGLIPAQVLIRQKGAIPLHILPHNAMGDTVSSAETGKDPYTSIDNITANSGQYTKSRKAWQSQNDPHGKLLHPPVGGIPNILWRAVRTSDLRQHPRYRPLPYPGDVRVHSARDLSLFRQDSWQWDALHSGRLTTSKAASCLGLYEHKAAQVLQIPRSLQGHGRAIAAWQHIKQRPPKNWKHLGRKSPHRSSINSASNDAQSDLKAEDKASPAAPSEATVSKGVKSKNYANGGHVDSTYGRLQNGPSATWRKPTGSYQTNKKKSSRSPSMRNCNGGTPFPPGTSASIGIQQETSRAQHAYEYHPHRERYESWAAGQQGSMMATAGGIIFSVPCPACVGFCSGKHRCISYPELFLNHGTHGTSSADCD